MKNREHPQQVEGPPEPKVNQATNQTDVKAEGGTDEQPKIPSTGVELLDDMIDCAHCAEAAMAYVLMKLGQYTIEGQEQLADKIAQRLQANFNPVIDNPDDPGNDFECDVSPVRRWLAFLAGFTLGKKLIIHIKPEGQELLKTLADEVLPPQQERERASEQLGDENKDQQNLNPILITVRKFLSTMTYREKLLVALAGQLLNKEPCFGDGILGADAYDDSSIANDLLRECESTVVAASHDSNYLKEADPIEALVTGFVISLLPMQV